MTPIGQGDRNALEGCRRLTLDANERTLMQAKERLGIRVSRGKYRDLWMDNDRSMASLVLLVHPVKDEGKGEEAQGKRAQPRVEAPAASAAPPHEEEAHEGCRCQGEEQQAEDYQ